MKRQDAGMGIGFWGSVGMGILWDTHRIFCGYGMGMGIEIPSPRQPCQLPNKRTVMLGLSRGSVYQGSLCNLVYYRYRHHRHHQLFSLKQYKHQWCCPWLWSLVLISGSVTSCDRQTDGQTDTRRQHIQRYMSTQSFVMHVMTFLVCHSFVNHILQ